MIILGLGSNIGDRAAHLRAAVQALSPVLQGIRSSRLYESAALLPPGAPESWNTPFLNMAVSGTSSLPPQRLLQEIKTIERDLGRTPGAVWCPREIDIDILAMDDLILTTPELTIPHLALATRDFALLPLADVAPGWIHPLTHIPVEGIIASQGFTLGKALRLYD